MIEIAFRIVEWFEARPAVGAVVYGWAFGVVVTQGCKRFYPLTWLADQDLVKRVSQAVATLSAGAFCWTVWPADTALRWPFAVLCGMACPQVYTALKFALPNVLKRWGWKAMWRQRASK